MFLPFIAGNDLTKAIHYLAQADAPIAGLWLQVTFTGYFIAPAIWHLNLERGAGLSYSAREIYPKGIVYPPQPEKMTGKLLKQVTIPIV
ncbi:hypothetical protein [Methylomonas sp. 11b]|uniref:hypothetical protein n=1 Tax=Methylomonas sp. 11b TaxID=1168169 RepID=UPI00047DADF0|nr:hypothetical protein [Methylomonas sp. 11b]